MPPPTALTQHGRLQRVLNLLGRKREAALDLLGRKREAALDLLGRKREAALDLMQATLCLLPLHSSSEK